MAKLAASEAATAVTHQVRIPVPRGGSGGLGVEWQEVGRLPLPSWSPSVADPAPHTAFSLRMPRFPR